MNRAIGFIGSCLTILVAIGVVWGLPIKVALPVLGVAAMMMIYAVRDGEV